MEDELNLPLPPPGLTDGRKANQSAMHLCMFVRGLEPKTGRVPNPNGAGYLRARHLSWEDGKLPSQPPSSSSAGAEST